MEKSLANPEIKARVEALLLQMNLDQKIGQMTQTERMSCTPEDVKNYHLGSVLSGGGSCPGDNRPDDWVRMNDAYWAASMEQSDEHLAIPIIYGVDAIHGNNNVLGATVFPHNIGLGAANDPELLQRIAQATAREILATGVEWTFAPTLAVARDKRWGRTYESYSEENTIVGSYAEKFVNGLQSDSHDDCVVACVKHWVGDGGTTHGIDQGDTALSFDELKRTHIEPYYAAIDAGVMTIMASFNSWNGDKCHGHRYLISDLLKDEMGFQGFVISDWDGIDYLSEDYFDAVGKGVNAGIDMFMVSEEWQPFLRHLKRHVQDGTVPMSRIDDAVRRILTVKFACGLFERPRPVERPWSNHECFGGSEHRDIAREAVRKSLVLLKNDSDLLPLNKQANILVAGKNAHNRGHQCGGFTVAWQGALDNETIEGGTSIWEGIHQQSPSATLSEDGRDADPEKHDVAIVVIGELPYAEGMGDIRDGNDVIVEAGSQIKGLMKVLEPYGHTLELAQLHPEDLATIQRIASKGIPVVTVLVSGRPLVVNRELDDSTSFVAAWLPGSEGQGVADVLFGDYDFQGRLSFSWPEKVSADAGIDDELFPYGYGLNYQ
ncbi:glycoside hydrolase family 3 protein [Porticoccus sp. W117]|uniref:glycoside hydrolase family 3 protein n=1 Tax=Porticoccus sp. W117 TaxID=3054777 RepID=UPI00259A710F|nr:glycoside hydrolase family 3 protein [Porticoccus sp. W117]MDM3870034.1 glycoside hydrolase family 3 protein [Porticoccus sp. W117]